MAAWASFVAKAHSYAIAFGVTGPLCTFLPLIFVKLTMPWADRPFRTTREQERGHNA